MVQIVALSQGGWHGTATGTNCYYVQPLHTDSQTIKCTFPRILYTMNGINCCNGVRVWVVCYSVDHHKFYKSNTPQIKVY